MSKNNSKRILLTGVPGIGKTTLIMKICDRLKQTNVHLTGFYTEELRDNFNKRIGFDIITFDGKREKLSRTLDHIKPQDSNRYKIGQYYVFPELFEKIVLPMFSEFSDGVLVLDEIGKMELLSGKFEQEVKNVFRNEKLCILATVPVKGKLPLIESLICDPNNQLIRVTHNNRNHLLQDILPVFQI
ncbi:hypothetical protein FQA39_LY02301 [Lamprigera yunnana]|nr:hypothetical protein FQA39_LY02301 [Lamprigera yunnana]